MNRNEIAKDIILKRKEFEERTKVFADCLNKQNKQKKTPKNNHEYDKEYREKRKIVLQRDGNRCVKCGNCIGLHVHHRQKRSDKGTNDIENLETLCYKCHKQEHKNDAVYNIMAG